MQLLFPKKLGVLTSSPLSWNPEKLLFVVELQIGCTILQNIWIGEHLLPILQCCVGSRRNCTQSTMRGLVGPLWWERTVPKVLHRLRQGAVAADLAFQWLCSKQWYNIWPTSLTFSLVCPIYGFKIQQNPSNNDWQGISIMAMKKENASLEFGLVHGPHMDRLYIINHAENLDCLFWGIMWNRWVSTLYRKYQLLSTVCLEASVVPYLLALWGLKVTITSNLLPGQSSPFAGLTVKICHSLKISIQWPKFRFEITTNFKACS